MILGKRMPSFRLAGTQEGFGLVPAMFIVPHFDAIPGIWKPVVFALQKQLKDRLRLIGVDEMPRVVLSMVNKKRWEKSQAHVFSRDRRFI
jgi:hypothetical protein